MGFISKAYGVVRDFVSYNVQTHRKLKDPGALAGNSACRGTADGEVYILYTGASLAGKDLSWLRGRDVIAANLAFMHENYRDIAVKHYALVENWSYRNLVFLGFVLDMALSRRKSGTRPTVWLSTSARHYVATPRLYNDFNTGDLFAGVDMRYVRNAGDFSQEGVVRTDFSQVCNVAQGTMTFCIFLAIYLGYKKIYLLGSDYSKTPILLGHFYDGVRQEVTPETLNEIAKSDVCGRTDARARAMNEYAKAVGVEIYNVVDEGFASPEFQSVDYVEVEKQCRNPA